MGKILNRRYEKGVRIGGGGMGEVYQAKDRQIGERPNDLLIMSSPDGSSWSGSQQVGYSSSVAPTLVVLNNTLYMFFVAKNASNSLKVISSVDGVNWVSKPPIQQDSSITPALAAWNDVLTMVFVSNDDNHKLLFTASN